MYWQSLWFQSPRGRFVGTRDFLFDRSRTKKVDDDIARQRATNDCGRTKSGTQARTRASRGRHEAERRAHPARDRRALDIILSIGHNSGLAAPHTRGLDARSGQLSHAKSPAQRRRVGDHGFAASDVMDRGLVHVLPWPWLGFIPYRDSRQARPRAVAQHLGSESALPNVSEQDFAPRRHNLLFRDHARTRDLIGLGLILLPRHRPLR